MTPLHDLTGLILAGGQGRRMGGVDKGLVPFAGRPLVAHVRDRLAGRVAELLVNANRSLADYDDFADRVIEDAEDGYQGPLMGIYSGLRAARTPWLLVVPCDTPRLPDDLVDRLVTGIGEADIAVAGDGQRLHPVVALIRTSLADDLAAALAAGERKIDRWYARHDWVQVDFAEGAEAFANLNTQEEKRRLELALVEEPAKR
ncbi:molybdenum cofactor guanylyltransferase [Halomonas sp. KAO]|uniref:molybdenum cofactor guanylyltransferase MobA n=1 Tax=unclassified Halomonas TaxID=2609666 RepID=UPI0018A0F4DF|nr:MULTISPECIES: molybdenum cofactor guanylyltransferase MobA [unclassified Halomonas]MBF7053146.1 molybdenum cofactor guanylyltransferase [Halomonas sp. KAO]MDT0499465.1 molybdenum cofactor guanylyltransferase MobA [Halomonas sp. PAR7]MDT0510718.1 molybdenum cofactor guanylyltransferase MobA [Halomonas sp. LES1]MDT0592269.1 molybdenum cofactor guanylyltransferase MobA [Halomonas sp. PAR8]